ncbi:MAG: hypothetical protein Q4C86_14380, partial [bacterium]|nr:hypothetical protein [bacterium]
SNRRIPNGTYGGVRGRPLIPFIFPQRKSALVLNAPIRNGKNAGESLNKRSILKLIQENHSVSIAGPAESTGVATRTVERNINPLKRKCYIDRLGTDAKGQRTITGKT